MKVLVTEDGWHGKAVNPFPQYNKGCSGQNVRVDWANFENEAKTYDLTEWCKPGSVIDAELVWQYRTNNDLVMRDIDKELKWATGREDLIKELYSDIPEAYRSVYQPIKLDTPKETVRIYHKPYSFGDYLKVTDKPKEGTVEEAALLFNKEHPEMDSWSTFIAGTEYILKQQSSNQYNKGIEDAIEWVEHLKDNLGESLIKVIDDEVACAYDDGIKEAQSGISNLIDQLKQLTQKP